MKVSDEKRQDLYNAIYQHVMDLRVELRMREPQISLTVDFQLAQLGEKIWEEQRKVLGVNG